MDVKNAIAACVIGIGVAAAAMPAHAVTTSPISTFEFAGTCSDCQGTAAGELKLSNYALGDAITDANFVSFSYAGTNLLAGYTISAGQDGYIAGMMGPNLPGPQYFNVVQGTPGAMDDRTFDERPNTSFYSSTDGFWCTGIGGCAADIGNSHTWNLASSAPADPTTPVPPTGTPVPEPMSLALLGTSLAGFGMLRRRR